MSGQDIIEAENRWARAIQAHQTDRLTALMHPNFVFLGLRSAGLSSWSRSEWIKAVDRIGFSFLEHKVRDLQVFGSTAVATIDGRWTAKAEGTAYDESFMMTDVWTKAPNASWRVVRRHSTRYLVDEVTGLPLDVPELTLDF